MGLRHMIIKEDERRSVDCRVLDQWKLHMFMRGEIGILLGVKRKL